VEIIVHPARPLHGDRLRKMGVRAAHPGGFGTRCEDVEVRHLRGGMHAGVGPAGPVTRTTAPAISASAASRRSCTVLPDGCDCQPLNGRPS
jgi:hypothetical protein